MANCSFESDWTFKAINCFSLLCKLLSKQMFWVFLTSFCFTIWVISTAFTYVLKASLFTRIWRELHSSFFYLIKKNIKRLYTFWDVKHLYNEKHSWVPSIFSLLFFYFLYEFLILKRVFSLLSPWFQQMLKAFYRFDKFDWRTHASRSVVQWNRSAKIWQFYYFLLNGRLGQMLSSITSYNLFMKCIL